MILVKQSGENWQYRLYENEADILLGLLKKFPFTEKNPAHISKTGKDAKVAEREKLLNESMADHRNELKRLAATLLGEEKWKKLEPGLLLTLDSGSREVLLQILNDIRVGCWHALGEPEDMEAPTAGKDLGHRNVMDLAGYFEMSLLGPSA